jgi:hypothetical protein
MIQSFNKHQKHFENCIVKVLEIVIQTPQFNNYEDICELFDIYIRKIVSDSSSSLQIKTDCLMMVNFFLSNDYISHIKSSFENENDAYHYLAIFVQFRRLSNRHKLISENQYQHFNTANLLKMVSVYKS